MSRNFEILRRAGREIELFRPPEVDVPGQVQVVPRPVNREAEVEVFAVPGSPRGRGTRVGAFFAIVLTGVGLSLYIYQRHIPLSQAKQVQFVEGTKFEGVIKPAHEIKVAAPVSGVVARVIANIGDTVKEGEPLLVLENRQLEAEVADAKLEQDTTGQQIAQLQLSLSGPNSSLLTQLAESNGRVSVLERRVQQVPTHERSQSPERAKAAYERTLAAFQRCEVLQKEGLTSEQQLEDARAALRIAEDDLKVAVKAQAAEEDLAREQQSQARLQVEVSRHQQLEQVQGLRLGYQKAAQVLKTAQQRMSEGLVKATSSGVVVQLPVKAGDQVAAGTMLARVAQLDLMVVQVEVGARVVNALHLKQRVVVTLPTVPPQDVEGVVTTIGPIPTANMNHVVEVEFSNASETLWVDQPAEVRFLP